MSHKSPAAVHYRHPDCSTGKLGWPTRRGAKDFNARIRRGGGDRLGPYKCDECGDWHLGHLPKAVKQGKVSRHDYYHPTATETTIGSPESPNSQESDRSAA